MRSQKEEQGVYCKITVSPEGTGCIMIGGILSHSKIGGKTLAFRRRLEFDFLCRKGSRVNEKSDTWLFT